MVGILNTTGLAVVLACTGLCASGVRADSRVLITSVESAEVVLDDESRATIDEAWATAAATIEEWRVVGTGISTSILRRDGGCGELDEHCLGRAAARRGTDRILLTSIHRTSDADDQVELRVRLFDRYTGAVRGTFQTMLELDDLDSSRELESLAAELMPLIGGLPVEGAAVIRAVEGAEVHVDGTFVGTVPASGELVLSPIPVGRRSLRVVRPSGSTWEAPVLIRPRASVAVTVDREGGALSFESGPTPRRANAVPVATPATPRWVLDAPGIVLAVDPSRMPTGGEITRVPLRIPLIEEHLMRGEIRSAPDARVGFMPFVSSSGARFTAKLHF